MGADTKKSSTWKLIIDKMHAKLAPWRRRHLSFGGRVSLVKSVLSFLSLYFISFFKISSKVLNILNRIQRNFLGCAKDEEKKVSWVK